jgi:DNA-binding NarL/FixJ family response regulator
VKPSKAISVANKLEVIKRIKEGQQSKDICLAVNLAISTVHMIFVQKEKIKEMAETYVGGA